MSLSETGSMDLFSIVEPILNHRRLLTSGDSSSWWVYLVSVIGLVIVVLILLRIVISISKRWSKVMQDRIDKAIKLRSKNKDTFHRQNGYSWDYLIVFPVRHHADKLTNTQEEYSLKNIVQRLADAGLKTKLFYSIQHDEVYCKIRAPLARLCKEAERTSLPLQLEPTVLANLLYLGNSREPPEKHWEGVTIPSTNIQTRIEPLEYIYASYKKEMGEKSLYKTGSSLGDSNCFLRSADRLKLIGGIIAANVDSGGCQLDIYKLVASGCILGSFGIHDRVELHTLEKLWLTFFQHPSYQRVDAVRDYFGEKIAFYFLFLGHYTSWLVWATVAGFIVYIDVAIENDDPNATLTPYFAVFMALWSTSFLESFKRHENRHSMMWGMTNTEENEAPRAEFIADKSVTCDQANPVDGSSNHYYYPKSEDRKRKCISLAVSVFFIMAVIAAVIGMFSAKFLMMSSDNPDVQKSAGIVAALLNAVQIQVMGTIYSSISLALNSYENHKTDTHYEDALIAKTFIIQFINSFSSMFFIAFGQMFLAFEFNSVPYCTGNRQAGGCMKVLQTTMGVLFLTNLIVGSLTTILVPYIQKRIKERAEFEDTDVKDVSNLEHEFMLLDYHPVKASFADYSVLVIQFAYATMFISAFPLASALALVNNYVMLRLNAWKFCQMCRRPEPRGVEDIGSWFLILEIISYAAVFVSSGLVAFTGSIAVNSTWPSRAWIFFGMSAGILIVKTIMTILISDTPVDVEIQLKRQAFIIDKLFNNIPDEKDETVVFRYSPAQQQGVYSFDIRINDDDPL